MINTSFIALLQKWNEIIHTIRLDRTQTNKPWTKHLCLVFSLLYCFYGLCAQLRRRQWHPTPVLLPGKTHGWRSLEGCSPWGRWGSDTTSLSLFTFMHWRRKWQPTPVFLPGESQGRGSLVGCRLGSYRVGHDWSDLAAAAAAVGSPCCPRDSQESSPTPQFKTINSSALSFLYSPTLTSIHDYWKSYSLD